MNEKARLYREKHRDRVRETHSNWQREHPDKVKRYCENWKEKNPEAYQEHYDNWFNGLTLKDLEKLVHNNVLISTDTEDDLVQFSDLVDVGVLKKFRPVK